ncbi:DUF692 domain-containing protein [Sandaracinus amylolyticus]|uniref:DUF692 domain-containing protein n=1 Tax=Sandaracinus amylolyticus TaxID=927083 RepID=UPI001F2376BF|nr:DUF692 domain-containing protein [Sandaracinus amylolyticus]
MSNIGSPAQGPAVRVGRTLPCGPSASEHSSWTETRLPIGVGLGWRPETAWACEQRATLAFSEVIAESVPVRGPLPRALERLLERGVPVVPHGVSLALGSADPPDRARLDRLAQVRARLGSTLVSEHVAFVRGAGLETEHLLPVPPTRAALAIVAENVQRAQDVLRVPLALENIASLFTWPEREMEVASFLAELCARTGALLLLDASNLHADVENHGARVSAFLDALPLDRIVYVHVAGGERRHGFYQDTHAHPVGEGPLGTLAAVLARTGPLPLLLERDDGFGRRDELDAELDAIAAILASCPAREVVSRTSSSPATRASETDRSALRDRQDAIVRALLADGDAPHDVHLERARHVLRAKRAWVDARRKRRAGSRGIWARLRAMLGALDGRSALG